MQRFYKGLSLALAFLLLACTLSVAAAESDFSDYTPIATKQALASIGANLSGRYVLTQNLEFTPADFAPDGAFYNNGAGFLPIGSSRTPFSGVLEGDGHTITGLTQSLSGGQELLAGLFGMVSGSVRNLSLAQGSVTLTASGYAGLLTAANSGSIENCRVEGEVRLSPAGRPDFEATAGGVAGINMGRIAHCRFAGSVTASPREAGFDAYVYGGGMAGYLQKNSTLQDCANAGEITVTAESSYFSARTYAGGVAGYAAAGTTVSGCYNTGAVTARIQADSSANAAFAGGLAGHVGGSLQNGYNTAPVLAAASGSAEENVAKAGGIAGENAGEATACYSLGSVAALAEDAAAGGLLGASTGGLQAGYYAADLPAVGGGQDKTGYCTDEALRRQETFVGFDFDRVWTIDEMSGYLYPQLQNNPQGSLTAISLEQNGGPYETVEGVPLTALPGTTLRLHYGAEQSRVIAATPDMLASLDYTKVGEWQVPLTYGGLQTEQTVTVTVKAKTPVSLTVLNPPQQTEYIENTKLDETGLRLQVTYDNGDKQELTGGWQTDYDFSKVGEATVTVRYGELTATFSVTVKAKTLAELTLLTPPAKTAYTVGEALDEAGITLSAVYDNGESETVTTGWEAEYDFTKAGEATVTLRYAGGEVTFTVTVTAAAPQLRYGDVNGDGQVNAADALEVLRFAVHKGELSDEAQTAAEVSGDGAINAADALLILRQAVGKLNRFPVEEAA